jgi:serine/threonine protein kinase
MSYYNMILDNMKFSYSSATSFITCPYMFKLTYIEALERGGNWYSDFGTLMHDILEKYFSDKLDIMELASEYQKNFPLMVTSPSPPYPVGIADRYYEDGLEFFETFDFDKSPYDIIHVESMNEVIYRDIKVLYKPDLILFDKTDKKYILFDFKTSNPFKNDKPDMKKMDEYIRQMYLYAYFMNHNPSNDIHIDKIKLWFVRVNKFYDFDYVEKEAEEVIAWFYNTILAIKNEEEFNHCDTTKNKFFCQMLCSVSQHCEFKP